MDFNEIISISSPVFKSYGIMRASLIGSVARKTDNESSDLDFLLDYPSGFSLMDLAGLKIDLEDKFGRKVDLISYNQLDDLSRPHILNEEQPIYG